jgi:hypothetical protein
MLDENMNKIMTMDELGIKSITGTYNREKGVEIKAIELKDAILVKKLITKIIPKEV